MTAIVLSGVDGALGSRVASLLGPGTGSMVTVKGARDIRSDASAVVHVSAAEAYGAWPDNPVPLTEDVALRPCLGASSAWSAAEGERAIAEWSSEHPGVPVAVLRPARVVGDERKLRPPGLRGRLRRARGAEAPPPQQFLHIDDLASAAAHALTLHLDGVFNVAANGWVAGDVAAELGGAGLGLAGAYALHPWVVANDRLRSTGWRPAYSNEEALVAARAGSRWRELSPQRRQELALGISGAVLAAGVAATVAIARRARSR